MGEDVQTAQSHPDGVPGSTAGAPAHDPGAPAPTPDIPTQILRFVDHHPLFRDLDAAQRTRVAASVVERLVPAHEAVLREGGAPAEGLFIVMEGVVEVLHGDQVVDVLGRSEVFGELTLLSGEAPVFTARAHDDTALLVVARDVATSVLSRPAGVAFMATAYRDRLLRSASTARSLPQAYTATVSSLVEHEAPVCGPETPIGEATALMSKEATTAILVETRAGLGIVTNADLRDKVLLAGVPVDAPVERIMSMPVTTVPENALASDAAVLMMDAGVKHLGVVDARGRPVGVISADSFMTLGALSPLALRHAPPPRRLPRAP